MFRNLSNYLRRIYLWIFSLIATAILIGPTSLAHAANITLAWAANTESDLAGYYIYYKTGTSGVPYNGAGVTEGNSPIRISLGDLSDPANPEFTLHGLSDTQTTYIVLTAYGAEGNESAYSNEVSYQPSVTPVTPTLSSLSISGNSSLVENSNASYTATATFSDGSTQTVSNSATGSDNSSSADINNSGVLSASEVSADTSVTVQASYTTGGVTRTATKVITIVDVPPSNLAPDTPVIVTPEMGQTEVEIPLDITTEPFSDPNNDGQTQSQWQISEQSDFSTRVIDITSNNYLTTFPVPHMVLKSDHHYYVRVRFFDSYSVASNWSNAVEFTTAIFSVDLNGNGIPDVDEVDNTVDFNLDGIPDINQPQIIKCVRDYDGSAAIGIQMVSNSTAEIESLEIIDPDTISDNTNRPADLIFGLFAYRLRVQNPGDTVKVRIYFSGEIFKSDVFYKYDTVNGWQNYSEHTTFNDDGQSITLEVKDGGFGDSDGLANGVIVDPGGIASGESTISTNVGSNVMGCFIATAAFGTKFEKHVQLLRRFRDLYLMPNSIGRAFVKAYYRYSPPIANFIARHDVLRAIVRWSLVPLITFSWMLLHFGLASTLLLTVVTFFGMFLGYRKIRH
jgi:chitinase